MREVFLYMMMCVCFRLGSTESVPYVVTKVSLPTVSVEHIPLYVDVDMPAHGNVRTKLPVTYNIYNRTPYSQELEINMETSDVFMFSGHKQVIYLHDFVKIIIPILCQVKTHG